MTHLVTMNRN